MLPDSLIEDKSLRQKYINKTEVLQKVKDLFFLPKTKMMTAKMVADFYEVSHRALHKIIERDGAELDSNGAELWSYDDIKSHFGSDKLSRPNIKEYGINTSYTAVFPKRAVLNVGMLLRDSKVAQRVRAALLDIEKAATPEQKTQEIDAESKLLLSIIKAETKEDIALATRELRQYYRRYKESYDRFLGIQDNMTMAKFAKMLNIKSLGRNNLFKLLKEWNYLQKNNEPYQQYVNQGLFKIKATIIYIKDEERIHSQTMVTPKGADRIYQRLKQEGRI